MSQVIKAGVYRCEHKVGPRMRKKGSTTQGIQGTEGGWIA